jgi:enoyl-CoA hydratase
MGEYKGPLGALSTIRSHVYPAAWSHATLRPCTASADDIAGHPRYDATMMDVTFERRAAVATVTLDRPQALNALTLAMADQLDRQLREWAADPAVAVVAIRSAGGRAFCAGGDIRALYEAGRRRDAYVADFYRTESRLNHRIKTYGKPYIALIDGIVMGGGVGLSIHGSHRVVTERCQFAMPETGIGFFPDVGASWFLPRCPGALGTYLGLTGARLGAADMLYCGLATHYVPSGELAALSEALEGARWADDHGATIDALLDRASRDPGPPALAQHRVTIDRCFGANSVEEVVARLEADGTEWARETVSILRRKSPTSLKVTMRQLQVGARLGSFAAAMRMEYRLARHFMAAPDFYEGVRAAVVDKDQTPRWQPASLAEVSDATVAEFFEPVDGSDLELAEES